VADAPAAPTIETMPTKAFFVDMLVRDIQLERAILDLVDNCIDGAKRLRSASPMKFNGLTAVIETSADQFTISDNCGGFDVATASQYAFRFGRPAGAGKTPYSIGQFGVGMKRALFKFGHWFRVTSATATERWSIEVDVSKWEEEPEWNFKFKSVDLHIRVPDEERGTTITVKQLRPEVAVKFGSSHFHRMVSETIRTHQRQFIAAGFGLTFNALSLTATDINLRDGEVSPSVEEFEDVRDGEKTVKVRIVAGAEDSNPTAAGWYVVCNGRVVLAADRSELTGWGHVAEQGKEIPKYHNQYARFRGVAYFDSEDAGRLPWNTTKDGTRIWSGARSIRRTASASCRGLGTTRCGFGTQRRVRR
jgi:hypothetical protein